MVGEPRRPGVGSARGGELGASIAVLPFADLSRERDQEYFCEGVAEEIINALARLENLRVASRTSAFRFKAGSADAREIGRKLRVGTLLEGSVRKDGDRCRISVQLTNAEDGYQLWSAAYDREMTEIFSMQEEIARQVVQALQVTLSPTEKATLGKAPTGDIQAYDYYLRGRSFYYRYGPREVEFAKQLFEQAIERDARYAPAWAGLADCWSYLYLYAGRKDAAREQADQASIKAVAARSRRRSRSVSRALALSLNERDEEAEVAFETAIRLDPDLFEAHYFYARHCVRPRQAGEGRPAVRRRHAGSPGRLPVAPAGRAELRRSGAARGCGRLPNAGNRAGRTTPETQSGRCPGALHGRQRDGGSGAERARRGSGPERALAVRPDDPMLLYNVGCIFSLLGCVEEAISCLEKGVDQGVAEKGWYEHDSNLDPLRGHPRFNT